MACFQWIEPSWDFKRWFARLPESKALFLISALNYHFFYLLFPFFLFSIRISIFLDLEFSNVSFENNDIFKKNCSLFSILPFQELAEGLTFIMLSPLPVLEKNSAGFSNTTKTVNLSESKTNQLDICIILHCLLNYKHLRGYDTLMISDWIVSIHSLKGCWFNLVRTCGWDHSRKQSILPIERITAWTVLKIRYLHSASMCDSNGGSGCR